MTKLAGPLRILIADDHELIRLGVRQILRAQRGWSVIGEAANGREAVEKSTQLKPDVVIVDVSMPDLNGLDATRKIREAAPKTQVLVLTMHESDQMVRKVLEAGARGYVLKSDLASHLPKAVKSVAQGKTYLTPKVSQIVLEALFNSPGEAKRTKQTQTRPTPRETQIIRLLAEGKSNKEIATALEIAVRTVETHRAKILSKLGFHSLADLIHYAIRHGIAPHEEPAS